MSEKTQGARNIAEEAFGNERKFKQLVGALSGPSRRERQNAAAALSFFAKDHPDLMIPFGAAVIDALNRPEAQTRWPVRLAAMRFLCKLGATTENRSERVWPLVDEAIQCYHGDLEFQDMLVSVIDFSAGKLAPSVKKELGARMAFDASNGKGPLKRRAQQIIDNVQD